jgi:hypothetical protein
VIDPDFFNRSRISIFIGFACTVLHIAGSAREDTKHQTQDALNLLK